MCCPVCIHNVHVMNVTQVVSMMMITFITFNSNLVPFFEGLSSSNPWEFECSGFRRNQTDDLGISNSSL